MIGRLEVPRLINVGGLLELADYFGGRCLVFDENLSLRLIHVDQPFCRHNLLFHCVPGYVQLAGYFFVGMIEVVQVDDSTYICHRFHLSAHLSAYFEREGFPSWGGQN